MTLRDTLIGIADAVSEAFDDKGVTVEVETEDGKTVSVPVMCLTPSFPESFSFKFDTKFGTDVVEVGATVSVEIKVDPDSVKLREAAIGSGQMKIRDLFIAIEEIISEWLRKRYDDKLRDVTFHLEDGSTFTILEIMITPPRPLKGFNFKVEGDIGTDSVEVGATASIEIKVDPDSWKAAPGFWKLREEADT